MGHQRTAIRIEEAISRLARRQAGVVGHAQLVRAGRVPEGDHRCAGAWTGRGPPPWCVRRGSNAADARDALYGASLAFGPAGGVSHYDALAAWGCTRPPTGPVHVTSPTARGRPGVRLHRAPLRDGDWAVRNGLRLTTIPRTLIDLAPWFTPRDLERTVDEAHYRGLVSARTLAEALERNRGRTGVPALRRLLRHHELGATRTETELEETFLRAVRAAGLPLPRCQQWIGRHRVDFLWPAERLVVETDGWAAHRGRRRQSEDASRDEQLAAKGYETLRIDEAEVERPPGEAVARVAERLSARRPSPAG